MVVGLGSYRDRNEAYPLDKKTLNQVALRSFFIGAANNSETGESAGWLNAILPGLKKIHTDEEDLALSMGHNLEYVNTGRWFSGLALGVVLALEQQKADLETIRSVRTAACALSDGLGNSVFRGLLIPVTAAFTIGMISAGNILGAVIYFTVLALAAIALRFALVRYGYSKGTRAIESMIRHKDALKHAARIAGVFMIGAMIVLYGSSLEYGLLSAGEQIALTMNTCMNGILPGILPLLVTLFSYRMMTKKNWSLAKCAIVILLFCLIAGFTGVFGGTYASGISALIG